MSSIGPQLPPGFERTNKPAEEDSDDDDSYGPSLPPDLVAARAAPASIPVAGPSTVRRPTGPSFPTTYPDEDDSDDDVGPKPLPAGVTHAPVDGVKQFMEKEERRREQVAEAEKPKKAKRDEWMLVPPSSSDLLAGLDPTKLKARQFARTAAPAKQVDNSLWTETPLERQQRLADEVSGKRKRASQVAADAHEENLEDRKKRKIDEELRRGVEEHTKKVRGANLMDIHKQSSASIEDDKKLGIWDHGRDMALSGRLMDDGARAKMVRDAKGLGDRFGSGGSGGFL